jgi:hypothetical protein
VRAANEQKKTVDAFLAGPPSAVPADDEAASEFVTHLSRLTASERPEPPLINYELLSLLHWHAGRTAEAIEWAWGVYDKSSQLDVDERARMLRWIAAMQRPPLQQETTQDLV